MIYGLVQNIDRAIVGSGTKFSTCMSHTKFGILDLLSVYFLEITALSTKTLVYWNIKSVCFKNNKTCLFYCQQNEKVFGCISIFFPKYRNIKKFWIGRFAYHCIWRYICNFIRKIYKLSVSTLCLISHIKHYGMARYILVQHGRVVMVVMKPN